MKKTEITPVELKNIIALRQLGSNWTKIKDETNVERRVAKRAYEEWEHDEEIKKRDAARFRVQAEAWHEHVDDLIRLAAGLVSRLSLPPIVTDLEINNEQFFALLWHYDFLQRYISSETRDKIYPGDSETYRREQELLFESLKVHTREKVQWDVLDIDWKGARAKCIDILPKLRKEISAVVGNSILQQKIVNFTEDTKKRTIDKADPQKRIEELLLTQIWKSVCLGKFELENPIFKTEIDGNVPLIISRDIHLKERDETVFIFNNIADKDITEKITRLCNTVFDTLTKGHEVHSLYIEVANMKNAREKLSEMLTPVKLKPVIMHSRCDLCPI